MDEYRVLICGSREWRDAEAIWRTLFGLHREAVSSNRKLIVISGGAKGADTLAHTWAEFGIKQGFSHLETEYYPADWATHGKAAGVIRNHQMLTEGKPELVYAFRINGESRGTDNMVSQAQHAGIPVLVVIPAIAKSMDFSWMDNGKKN
jgi:hypothetical protein